MKYKKIRGHKRRLKQIEHWKQFHLSANLGKILSPNEHHYAKIRIYPWNGFTGSSSKTPEPKAITKQAMLAGLLDIYDSWKLQLDNTGKPYYLKIWLYEPHFSESQVVCAIGEKLCFYDHAFLEDDDDKILDTSKYRSVAERLTLLQWVHHIDEEHHQNNLVGNPEDYASPKDYHETRKWFNRMMKKPHRITPYGNPTDECFEFYSFKNGDVWVGGK